MNDIAFPFSRPLYVMAKPVGPRCNLACDYCYYLEKTNLYNGHSKQMMSETLLERFIQEYIASQTMPVVSFTWHGGEPLLQSLRFYQKAVELQKNMQEVERLTIAFRLMVHCLLTSGVVFQR